MVLTFSVLHVYPTSTLRTYPFLIDIHWVANMVENFKSYNSSEVHTNYKDYSVVRQIRDFSSKGHMMCVLATCR